MANKKDLPPTLRELHAGVLSVVHQGKGSEFMTLGASSTGNRFLQAKASLHMKELLILYTSWN